MRRFPRGPSVTDRRSEASATPPALITPSNHHAESSHSTYTSSSVEYTNLQVRSNQRRRTIDSSLRSSDQITEPLFLSFPLRCLQLREK